MPLESPPQPSLARFACLPCRRSKRKCDRIRPMCGLCEKNEIECEYHNKPSARQKQLQSLSTSTAPLPTSSSNGHLSPGRNETRKFPPVYFLNGQIFSQAGMVLPSPSIPIPTHILELLEDTKLVRSCVAEYFNTIQSYLPIFSKARFYNQVLNPLLPMHAEKALLILCMKAVTLCPSSERSMAMDPNYVAAKNFRAELEGAGVKGSNFLQASILLCLYEFGHAIYPEVYYSIAATVRLGVGFGMDGLEGSTKELHSDWIQDEELRRVWWAVLILDRCINLGNPSRPLAAQEPSASSVLPVDDQSWDSGIHPQSLTLAFSSSSLHTGKFARFAQAICLLGRTYRHIHDRIPDTVFMEAEAEQLRRTLQALAELVDVEMKSFMFSKKLEYCTQVAVCYSALMILQQVYSMLSPVSTLHDSQLANTDIEAIANEGTRIAITFLSHMPNAPVDKVSPFILHFMHQCAIFFIDKQRERSEIHSASIQSLKDLFHLLSQRWRAANAYLEIIEAYEVMKMV
ncbi:hypothetical protein BGZ60DRAFT_251336 [Tricladium varicosporioides]|nr:hypothetical protein BGZ60DRAFT_251336 [Hymenoscyphus varicosporioides]